MIDKHIEDLLISEFYEDFQLGMEIMKSRNIDFSEELRVHLEHKSSFTFVYYSWGEGSSVERFGKWGKHSPYAAIVIDPFSTGQYLKDPTRCLLLNEINK